MTMPPRYYVTAVPKMTKKAGLRRIRGQKDIYVRTTAYENVLVNDVGLLTDFSEKENTSAHARRRGSCCVIRRSGQDPDGFPLCL
jgi:hypothetical protein